MHQINIIFDPGDDITLLTRKTADSLGLNPETMPGSTFPVTGITGAGQPFKKINNLIQIGELSPIYIPMGLAFQPESLAEDLLGRKGVMDGPYQTVIEPQGLTFVERAPAFSALANSGARLSHAMRAAFRGYSRTW